MLPVVWHLACLLWLILLFPVHASFIKVIKKALAYAWRIKAFTATPPVSRIDAKRGQTIKLMYTGSTVLPSDKESVFWFNVLEVPPKPDATKVENQSLLQLAFRTRIKLFYRPAGLNGNPSEAPLALKWKWAEGKSGLSVYNPTPYYVSFNSAELIAGGKSNPLNVKMVAPKSEEIFTISGSGGKATSGKVHFSAINDFGGAIEGDVNL